MEQCDSLADLAAHFEGRLSTLRQCMHLQAAHHDAPCEPILRTIQATLSQLEKDLAKMRTQLTAQQQAIEVAKVCIFPVINVLLWFYVISSHGTSL